MRRNWRKIPKAAAYVNYKPSPDSIRPNKEDVEIVFRLL